MYRRAGRVVLCALSLAFAGRAAAVSPSFDCAKARTGVERAVCVDQVLSELDRHLADVYQKALLGQTRESRARLVAEQRRWIADRDHRCVCDGIRTCLVDAYRLRIAQLRGDRFSVASCQAVADAWRPLSKSHPDQWPLDALSKDAGGRVRLVEAERIEHESGLASWAERQIPPVRLPEGLNDELHGLQMYGWAQIQRIPGTHRYALDVTEGTARCVRSWHFDVAQDGSATLTQLPPNIAGGDETSGCGAVRSIGTVDGQAVHVEEWYDRTSSTRSSMTVATWDGSAFSTACQIEFRYAPLFDRNTIDSWTDCSEPKCEPFHVDGPRIVESVQKDGPAAAAREFVARLTPEQRQHYLRGATEPEPIDAADAAQEKICPADFAGGLTKEAPLALPVVVDGRLYEVRVGHQTSGWRWYADWSLSFFTVEKDGRRTPAGEIAVGIHKGRVLEAVVSPLPWPRP